MRPNLRMTSAVRKDVETLEERICALMRGGQTSEGKTSAGKRGEQSKDTICRDKNECGRRHGEAHQAQARRVG